MSWGLNFAPRIALWSCQTGVNSLELKKGIFFHYLTELKMLGSTDKAVRQMKKYVKMRNVWEFQSTRASSGCQQYLLYRWSRSGKGSLVQRHRWINQMVCAGLVLGRHFPDAKDTVLLSQPWFHSNYFSRQYLRYQHRQYCPKQHQPHLLPDSTSNHWLVAQRNGWFIALWVWCCKRWWRAEIYDWPSKSHGRTCNYFQWLDWQINS